MRAGRLTADALMSIALATNLIDRGLTITFHHRQMISISQCSFSRALAATGCPATKTMFAIGFVLWPLSPSRILAPCLEPMTGETVSAVTLA